MKYVPIVTMITCSFVVIAFAAACNGLDPGDLPPDSYLEGTITYKGGVDAWPDTTVYQVLVIAFENQPLNTDDILKSFQNSQVVISETLPDSVESTEYRFRIPMPPRTFNYVVVAMRDGPNFLADWKMLAVYSEKGDPSSPGQVVVNVGSVVNIDFLVDFDNLPPQPLP
ncbi:MAG: hypothetical protein HYX66_02040 [Ignavibacteria bacterium]|nr:hypothetical protein [Ignavibacteria bacterium]